MDTCKPTAPCTSRELDAALATLPAQSRTAVSLYYFEDMTLAQTSLALRLSERATFDVITRAIADLRQHFAVAV